MEKEMSIEEMKKSFEYINYNNLYFYAKDHNKADAIKRRMEKLEDPSVIHGILVENNRYKHLPKGQKRVIELFSRMEALVDFNTQNIKWIE